MSKTKTVRDPLVRHSQLRVLIDHISTLIAALDVRLGECEKVRQVDPGVKEAADAMIADARRGVLSSERALMLVPDGATEEPKHEFDANGRSKDWKAIEASLPEVPLGDVEP